MPQSNTHEKIRVGVYGTGRFANRTHIPNLQRLEHVELVALCDADPAALAATASRVPGARTYADAHVMLEAERLDALYSCVPPYARTDVEIAAAQRGVHLFSEKPQALAMGVARAIDEAIRQAGVLGTVGYRERYRPLFQEARRFLADKQVVHAAFMQMRPLPVAEPVRSTDRQGLAPWYADMARSGGAALDWGVHAVDIIRYITGRNVARMQAFYVERPAYSVALSSSFNGCLDNGASLSLALVSSLGDKGQGRGMDFTVFYEGGFLEIGDYHDLRVDSEVIYHAEDYDPWFEHDRVFTEAVRTGDASNMLNDYHDGLSSLAPILAGWESARRGGETLDLARFMAED